MDYQIAIPSYKRAETCRDKTLAYLATQPDIDPNRVTVFVANEEEKKGYERTLKDTPYNNIIVGVVGMGPIRNFIRLHYSPGQFIVNMDDDLSSVQKRHEEGEKLSLVPVEDLRNEVIVPMHKAMLDNQTKLVGIYAAANAFFMKERVAVGLYYCIGSLWGCINSHDENRMVQLCDKEDFERTLQHYEADGQVTRLDWITVDSKYYTEDGGMQVERTLERIDKSAKILVKRFPGLCTDYVRKTTGHTELKLRDTRVKVDKNQTSLF